MPSAIIERPSKNHVQSRLSVMCREADIFAIKTAPNKVLFSLLFNFFCSFDGSKSTKCDACYIQKHSTSIAGIFNLTDMCDCRHYKRQQTRYCDNQLYDSI